MAVTGENFCTSAWNGFLLNLSYGLTFAWSNLLASMFIFLGKLFIVVVNCFTLLAIMKARGDTEEVTSIGGPLITCCIASYFTANLFLGVMDEAALAIMTCLCIDTGVNEGEPQFGPKTFYDGEKEGGKNDGFKKTKAIEMV